MVLVVEGMDKLWALKSTLTIPLANVRGATADPGITGDRKGLRGPGTHIRGVITAGTCRQDGEKVFWDVHDPRHAVVIELIDQEYARLVVDVDDPRSAVDVISRALADL